KHRHLFVLVLALLTAAGCGTTVKRVDVEAPVDYSGRWNDTDSRLVAKEMIDDSLSRSWVAVFQTENKRPPVVIVGSVVNKSHEHINSDVFTKDLERSLLNSGRVKFVASRQERTDVREERVDQQGAFTNSATRRKMAMETGADYMLIGSINSIKDETRGRYVIMYQVNLEMVDLATNEKVWIGQKDIKKVVQKSKYSL
ncbi:MAG: penicillin-binding protein activator LpoB, partial [Candidatus Omnitrophota bacterium]|nr:penicillin-binding protein activator LpoB [Candidatus Omnitrophota bacterium]